MLLAFSAVLGPIGSGALVSHLVHASDTTSSVVLLMGMAVGVGAWVGMVVTLRSFVDALGVWRGEPPGRATRRSRATTARG